jgi:hypothetical protein
VSRHSYQTAKHVIVLGLDAPLANFFGQVWTIKGKTPKMLGGGAGYDATQAGLQALLAEAENFAPVPVTVREGLERDLEQLIVGHDIGFQKVHRI